MFDIQVRLFLRGRAVAVDEFVGALALEVARKIRSEARASGVEREHERKPLAVGITEAARMLGISPWTLRLPIRRGAVQAVRVGSRVLLPMEVMERVAVEGMPSVSR